MAFRELGLAIGLRAVGKLRDLVTNDPGPFRTSRHIHPGLDAMMHHTRLIAAIEGFWLEPANRESGSWNEHRDINMVMLATSLAPDGFLDLS